MRILVYGIGGDFNERLVGTAHDPSTGLSLLRLLRLTRASGCSLHGSGLDPQYDTSGELSINSAASMFIEALDRYPEAVLTAVDPPDDE
jgi:hypothetical protein